MGILVEKDKKEKMERKKNLKLSVWKKYGPYQKKKQKKKDKTPTHDM